MRKRFHHGVTRMLLPACALLFLAPPSIAAGAGKDEG
jgi:hypothetical protein